MVDRAVSDRSTARPKLSTVGAAPRGPMVGRVGRRSTSASAAVSGMARAADLAARWILAGRRLEMQGLADELGVSRITLFRHVRSREALFVEALWLLTERTMRLAVGRWEAERTAGALHCVGIGRNMNELVSQSTALHRLLADEPVLAVRVLTDPRGKIQSGVVAFVEALLRRDMTEHGLRPLVDPGDLAFALVRLGESFLYADVLAARRPDVEAANRLQQAVIESARITDHPYPDPPTPDRSRQ